MTRRRTYGVVPFASAAALLAGLLAFMPTMKPLFAWLFPEARPPIYEGETFAALWLSHAALVGAACLCAAALAVGLGIFVTRRTGRDFRAITEAVATIGQSCPPAAVLAVAVPVLGYGPLPTFVALAIYGFLPILENTVAALDGVSETVREAALGLGFSPGQMLLRAELPLAAPTILAGIRTAVVINIGTAAVGSTVGALTLGTPIIDGLVSDKLQYVLQGAVVVAVFAVATDMGFDCVERWLRRHEPAA